MGEIFKMKKYYCKTNESIHKSIHKDLNKLIDKERKNIQAKIGKKEKVSSVFASKMLARRLKDVI